MAVRSAALASGQNTTSLDLIVFTVPDQETWLLKSIYLRAIGAQTIQAYITTPTQTGGVRILEETLAASGPAFWEGWIALEPGSQLRIASTVANFRWHVSGAELEGVAD